MLHPGPFDAARPDRHLLSCRSFKLVHVIAVVFSLVASWSCLAQDLETHRVEGVGPTFTEARQEAVRQALQKSVRQLIVADRLVVNDEVMEDRILATLNGFVHEVDVVSREQTDFGEFVVMADVTISGQAIANFASVVSGSSAEIDGESLFAEAQRTRRHSEVIGELVSGVLDGFPRDAVEVAPTNVSVEPDGEISIDFNIEPVDSFYSSLRQMLDALVPGQRFSASRRTWSHPAEDLQRRAFCVQYADSGKGPTGRYPGYDCWPLSPSSVYEPAYLWGEYAMFVFSVVDQDGESVLQSERPCLWGERMTRLPRPRLIEILDSQVNYRLFRIPKAKMTVRMPASAIDLERASSVIAMAVQYRYPERYQVALGEPAVAPSELCQSLFEYHGHSL